MKVFRGIFTISSNLDDRVILVHIDFLSGDIAPRAVLRSSERRRQCDCFMHSRQNLKGNKDIRFYFHCDRCQAIHVNTPAMMVK